MNRQAFAHVGSYKNDNDAGMMMMAVGWIDDHAPGLFKMMEGCEIGHDHINLDYGRDFLKEDRPYDVVMLHYIWAPNRAKAHRDKPGILNTSRLHCRRRWCEQLIKSGAHLIFAYGDSTEVSGRYLGDIDGYRRTASKTGRDPMARWQTVYVKNDGSET